MKDKEMLYSRLVDVTKRCFVSESVGEFMFDKHHFVPNILSSKPE